MFHQIVFSVCVVCLGVSVEVSAQESSKSAGSSKAAADVRVSAEPATQRTATGGKSDVLDGIAMRHQLELLKKRRQRLGLNLGEAHPTMLRLDEAIRTLSEKLLNPLGSEDFLERANPKIVDNLKEDELRELVGELVKRVLVLEEEVHSLRESPELSRHLSE